MPDYLRLLGECYGKPPEESVKIAVEVYKDCGKQLRDVQARAKKIIEEIITETGQVDWDTSAGKVYFPKPSLVVTYDTKALDALCASSPELKAVLWPHRKETERAGSMTIK